MTHYMKLKEQSFSLISQGRKTIELRLNDEKRRQIKVDDIIEFTELSPANRKISVKVTAISHFRSFKELYSSMDPAGFGYYPNELSSDSYKDMYEYYSQKEQDKYGVIAIEFERIAHDIYVFPNRLFLEHVSIDEIIKMDGAVIACTSFPEVAKRYDKYPDDRKLVLFFDDTEEEDHINAFNSEIAKRIKEFFLNNCREVFELYVCCDGGESRSAAIAAVLNRYWFGCKADRSNLTYGRAISKTEKEIWEKYNPNKLVYELLSREFEFSIY